ncbi:MAG: hypothetical protein M1839_001284 [Geoglossum umbratile]|nr:MAG: hypothetical protein M1839_001284 [Geoglossum umbratile]
MPSKPAQLQTKGLSAKALKSASLPSELSKSPMPWTPVTIKTEDGVGIKTPITPPVAYTDFLRALSSPGALSVSKQSTTSNPSSQPSTASSCSCNCENHQSPSSAYPPTPYTFPLAAAGRKFRLPTSPACSGSNSPTSAHQLQSPFSLRSPQDWDPEKVRLPDTPRSGGDRVCVRQVVTRTVTYTTRGCPRMNLAPAPKGKRRRLE